MRPPSVYGRIRSTRPVSRARMPDGQLVWLVTSYQLSREILADPRVSSDRADPAFPFMGSRGTATIRSMLTSDPPAHGAHRKMLISEFSRASVARLRPRIGDIVDRCVDDLLSVPTPADLVEHVALPVPSLVICEILGVPGEKRHDFQNWTTTLLTRNTPAEQARASQSALTDFMDALVTAKENGAPGDDALGRLVARNRQTGSLTHDEVVADAMLLLVAGHETTANMISLGTAALLENPTLWAELAADPSLLPDAVEELLRYFSIVQGVTSRVAKADIRLGEITIRAGEGIVVSPIAADWDDSIFNSPEKLDFHRNGSPHIAFGHGAHQCLGQHLARAELQIVYETLIRRVPGLRLARPANELPYRDHSSVYGIERMPVTF
jgi:cytochrome P450